jgi:hypothetical protein
LSFFKVWLSVLLLGRKNTVAVPLSQGPSWFE